MEKLIKEFCEFREVLREQLKVYVTNRDIPLEKRWRLFIESDLGLYQTWMCDLKSFNLECWHSYMDRHRQYAAEQIVDYIEECQEEDEIPPETIIMVKEELLAEFIKSFEYDW